MADEAGLLQRLALFDLRAGGTLAVTGPLSD
jgi:hypothetical protein